MNKILNMFSRYIRKILFEYLAENIPLHNILLKQAESEYKRKCTVGEAFRTGAYARCYNHSSDKERILIGNGVLIDGTIECYKKGSIIIGDYSFIGRSRVYCATSVSIGKGVLVSDNVCIMDSDLHSYSASERYVGAKAWVDGEFPDVYTSISSDPIIIGDYVWIGFGACILKGISIGTGAIVGAGSVVTRDVTPWTVVAGNPAREIKTIPVDER